MVNNTVNAQDLPNIVTVVTDETTVHVTQQTTKVVEVLTPGPQGPPGPPGQSGQGDSTGLVTTSSFNAFTSSYIVDSASFVSRINASNTGSFTGSFTGSLLGTASTSSYVTGSIFGGTNLVLSSSYSLTASYALSSNTFTTSIGNGTLTDIGVTHNLGTRDLIIQLYDNTTYETILCDITRTTVNHITCSFATPPSLNQYRVVIKA